MQERVSDLFLIYIALLFEKHFSYINIYLNATGHTAIKYMVYISNKWHSQSIHS